MSYLLPPRWVRRLSFSTYLSRPSRSRLHLVGTVPETKLDLGPDADERFYLFDFPGERFPALDEHPLASLCVSIGLRELPALWAWADSLADGKEATLDDWYPVVTAAAALGRAPLTEADLDAVIAWLGAREDLPKGTQNAIARAVHGHTAIAMGHRRTLLTVADRTGDAGLWEQVQYGLLEPLLLDRTDGATVVTALASCTPSSAQVREQLTARAEEQLRLAEEPADTLSLLDWSVHAELPIDPDVLAECGRSIVAPLLAGGQPLPPSQRDQAARVASRWRAVREGIAGYLTDLADQDLAKAAAGLAGLAGELLTEQDIPAGSPILVPYLAYRGLRSHERPAAILGDLARRGVIAQADNLLLTVLWPGPRLAAGGCGGGPRHGRPARARGRARLVRRGAGQQAVAGELPCLRRAVPQPPGLPAGRPARRPGAAGPAGDHDLHGAASEARRLLDLLPVIDAQHRHGSAPALVLSREWLAPEVARLPVDRTVELVKALAKLSAPGLTRYLHPIAGRFSAPGGDIAKHAAALWVIDRAKRAGATLR